MAGYQSNFTGVEALKVTIKHKWRLHSAKRQNNTSLHCRDLTPIDGSDSWHARITYCAERHDWLSYEASLNASQRGWSPRGILWNIPATCGQTCTCRPASPVLVAFGWVYEWFVGKLPFAIVTVNTNDTVSTLLRFQTAVHTPIKYVKHVSNEPH